MTHREDRPELEVEHISVDGIPAPAGGWPAPEYIRVRLLESAYDGPVVSDSKMDVWNDRPAETFDLFGHTWRRIAYRRAQEDGQLIFLVVVEAKSATHDDLDGESEQATDFDGYFPLDRIEPGAYQSRFTLRLDDGTVLREEAAHDYLRPRHSARGHD